MKLSDGFDAKRLRSREPRNWSMRFAAAFSALLATLGVLLAMAGTASLLGHAQASTTLDIYAHAFDKNKRKAQEKLGKAIGL